VGHYSKPDDADIYNPLTITVSTVSGQAFVQLDDYISTDNVVICLPKKDYKITTLFFVVMMLNRGKWRWMYGRQCYKTKFSKTVILLPYSDGKLDESFMRNFVESQPAWDIIDRYVKKH